MSRIGPRAILACALLMSAVTACTPPADPVLSGRLCAPEQPAQSCESSVIVLRNTTDGRNALDFRLTNQSSSEATLRVLSGVAATQSTLADLDMSGADDGVDPTAPNISPCAPTCEELEVTLAPGASALNRFTPTQLGRRQEVFLGVVCVSGACDAMLEYVLVVEPLECNEDSDCSSGWLCDIEAGQCFECLGDDAEGQCAEGQSCQLGRCLPPQSTCSAAPSPSTPTPAAPIVLALLAMTWRVRRRRRTLLTSTVLVALTCASAAAFAQDAPTNEPSPDAAPTPLSTHFTVGAATRFFTGEVGGLTKTGYGLDIGEELQWGNIGAGASITAGFFVTNVGDGAVLPLARTLQTYSFQIGPRLFFPISRPVDLYARLDYERLGLASNSLFELTGPQIGYNSIHGAFGARLRAFAPVEVRLQGAYHYIFGFPGSMFSVVLSVGIAGP